MGGGSEGAFRQRKSSFAVFTRVARSLFAGDLIGSVRIGGDFRACCGEDAEA